MTEYKLQRSTPQSLVKSGGRPSFSVVIVDYRRDLPVRSAFCKCHPETSSANLNMFSSFSLPFSSWLKSNSHGKGVIDLAPVPIHDVQVSHDRRTRRLRALLKANHANHSVIYHNLTFHNHTPHVCL